MKGLIFLVFLTGCAALPPATSQIRITEGDVGAGGLTPMDAGVKGNGNTCIVSIVGELPETLRVIYKGERCQVKK